MHRRYPELPLYQTEQECGDGKNDWRYCRYAWSLMKHYLQSGASAYLYWNISLKKGGVSRWGWAQNSLVTVDTDAGTFAYTHEYYLMKHLSAFVRPGARRVEAVSWNGYENQLAFVNPDGSSIVVIQNDMSEPQPVRIAVGGASSRRPCRPTRSRRWSSRRACLSLASRLAYASGGRWHLHRNEDHVLAPARTAARSDFDRVGLEPAALQPAQVSLVRAGGPHRERAALLERGVARDDPAGVVQARRSPRGSAPRARCPHPAGSRRNGRAPRRCACARRPRVP